MEFYRERVVKADSVLSIIAIDAPTPTIMNLFVIRVVSTSSFTVSLSSTLSALVTVIDVENFKEGTELSVRFLGPSPFN